MCECVCVVSSLIVLLLNDVGQLGAKLLDVVETNEQGVPLGTNELSCRRQILQLPLVFLVPDI